MNSQSKAKQRYNNKTYDRIEVKVRKGTKDIIKSHAESIGKSLNGYINDLIMSDIGTVIPEHETKKQ